MNFFTLPRAHSPAFIAVVLVGLLGSVGATTSLRAQEPVSPRPERIGSDAPRQERNPTTQRPEEYKLRSVPAPAAVVETDTVKVKIGNESPPPKVVTVKKARGVRPVRRAATEKRTVLVRKAEPIVPILDEVAAERAARREERNRPQRVGNDAPHYERSGNPDGFAARLISIEHP